MSKTEFKDKEEVGDTWLIPIWETVREAKLEVPIKLDYWEVHGLFCSFFL